MAPSTAVISCVLINKYQFVLGPTAVYGCMLSMAAPADRIDSSDEHAARTPIR
jgi:hypothetical protein